jgi:hypothetical protein
MEKARISSRKDVESVELKVIKQQIAAGKRTRTRKNANMVEKYKERR